MSPSHRLALLIAAPQPGETAMLADQAAMTQALQVRGFAADEILCLHGRLDRPLVMAFLHAASLRLATWAEGALFVHVSGHGFFAGETVDAARPGLLFTESDDVADDGHLFWDDFFAALALPAGVRMTLLPDIWHANLLVGRAPANTAFLGMKALLGAELACRAQNLPAAHPAQPRGIISYYATRALTEATSVGDWLARCQALVQQDVLAGRLPPFYQPDLQVIGDGGLLLF